MSDTSLTTIEEMTFEDKRSALSTVILPPVAVEGLNDTQVGTMKEVVYSVNNNMRVMGEVVRSTAYELTRLKESIPSGKWGVFLKSGSLPIPERQARDLVRAWKWLKDTPLTDGDLAGVGTRTLARIGTSSPSTKKQAEKKIKEKGVFTETDLNEIQMGGISEKGLLTIKKKNEETVSINMRMKKLTEDNKELTEKNKTLMKENNEMKKENTTLQDRINSLKINPDKVG